MKSEIELQVFFDSILKPEFDSLEQFRIERIKKCKKYFFIGSSCCILFIISVFINSFFIILFLIPTVVCFGLTFQVLFDMAKYLKRQFKCSVLPKLLDFLYTDYEYIPNQKIAKTVLEKSMLFPHHVTSAEGEDFMRFKLGESSIMFCETTVYCIREVIFSGIFISATFNKHFNSKTFVLPAKPSSFFYSIKKQLFSNFSQVKLEDVEFDNVFHVLSTDQVEARYILTTSLMKRILDYKNKTKSEVSFSFVDDRLYCAIPNYSNLFEPAIFETFDFNFLKRNYNPLKLYTDLVEDLNLNLRIWTKE